MSVYKIMEDASKALTDYIHGKSNFSSAEDGAKPLIDYVHENYCSNRDVATGNYDCPYATTVMNTICCTGHECNHKGIYEKSVVNNSVMCESKECMYNGGDYAKKYLIGETERERYFKLHSGSVYGNTVYRIVLGEDIRYLPDDKFPF